RTAVDAGWAELDPGPGPGGQVGGPHAHPARRAADRRRAGPRRPLGGVVGPAAGRRLTVVTGAARPAGPAARRRPAPACSSRPRTESSPDEHTSELQSGENL